MKDFQNNHFLLIIIAILFFILLTPITSFALGDGIKLGEVATARPIFRLKQQFDSNVYLQAIDDKSDWITSLDAGTDVEMKMGDVLCKAGYLFNMNLFAGQRKENNYNHTVTGLADWKLTNFEIVAKDKYRHFSDRSGSENTSRLSRQNNALSVDLLCERDRLGFDFGYDFVIEDYLSNTLIAPSVTYDDAEDRYEHTLRGEASYKFFPKTSVLGEVDFGLIDYPFNYNSDSYFIQPLVGLRGELMADSTADIKVGFRYQDYESSADRDYVGPVAKSSITKKFGERDVVTLRLERLVEESTYRRLNYYTLNYVGLGYVHKLSDKLSANFTGSYQITLYPKKTTENGVTAKRHDNFYTGECSLKYDIQKWLTTELSYTYMQRESRFADFDYIDNLVSLSGLLQF